MTDIYTKQFIAMRYWLLGRNYFLALDALEYAAKLHIGTRKDGRTQEYFQETYILPALKEARRLFPRQEPAYENIRHVLVSQIELLQAVHKAHTSKNP